ncbi:hypothetical protein ABT160_18945 [Streptomyces sp. NPDC001941]|uniref:hypothetical protein n=1 Tax=Streptomyces sp. NPDC001941 TaxID=3154659 RepID=UPI0033236A46
MTSLRNWDGSQEPFTLTRDELAALRRISEEPAYLPDDTPGLKGLCDKGLALAYGYDPGNLDRPDVPPDDGRSFYFPMPTAPVLDQLRRQALAKAREVIQNAEMLTAFFDTLPRQAGSENGIEFMDAGGEATQMIIRAMENAQHDIKTAQPAYRRPDTMDQSASFLAEPLSRGVALFDIYPPNTQNQPHMNKYVQTVTAYGPHAQVRRLLTPFPRIVIVDKMCIIQDLREGSDDSRVAWKVTHEGMVAFILMIFDWMWDMAGPWHGDTPSGQGQQTFTNDRTRAILRGMAAHKSLSVIAKEMRVSTKTLGNELAALDAKLGFPPGRNDFPRGMWWVTSSEQDIHP